jgi:hypothetical protein
MTFNFSRKDRHPEVVLRIFNRLLLENRQSSLFDRQPEKIPDMMDTSSTVYGDYSAFSANLETDGHHQKKAEIDGISRMISRAVHCGNSLRMSGSSKVAHKLIASSSLRRDIPSKWSGVCAT